MLEPGGSQGESQRWDVRREGCSGVRPRSKTHQAPSETSWPTTLLLLLDQK